MTTGTEGPDNLTNDQNIEDETVDALGGDDVVTVRRPSLTPSSGETVQVNGGSGFDTIIVDSNNNFVRLNWAIVSGSDVSVNFRTGNGVNWILNFNSVERFDANIGMIGGSYYFGDEKDVLRVDPETGGVLDTGGGNDEIRVIGEMLYPATFNGGAGNDVVDLTEVTTHFYGSNVSGGDGDDILTGMQRSDLLDGGAGNDILIGNSTTDAIPVTDQFVGGSGADTITGSLALGTDRLRYDLETGTAGALVNLSDSATVLGGVALASGEARDTFGDTDTLTGIDHVDGNVGNDRFLGHSGANQLAGGAGDDILSGGGGDDLLVGGADDDTLVAGTGTDSLTGGEGHDALYFGTAYTTADAPDGGVGVDVLILQGNYTTILGANTLAGLEALSLQSGSVTFWGDTANNRYDYNITTVNSNVLDGTQMIVNGQSLLADEDFTFDGSAESDGAFILYAGHGVDTLKGGANGDAFFFEGTRWSANDKVDGGGGADVLVISAGSGTNQYTFNDTSFVNVEAISVSNRFTSDPTQKPSYELVLANGNVGAGQSLIVNGNSLDSTQTIVIDGSAVQAGSLTLYGGAGSDTLKGGGGIDLLYGADGADDLTGGGGADVFRYDSVSESNGGAADLILDFATGTDKIDLSRIDANTHAAGDQAFTWIGASAFGATGASSAGQLRAFEDDGQWRVEGDTNGDGSADFILFFQPGTAPVQSDFLL